MQVSTVRADDTATTAATAAAKKPEVFEGHYVKKGQVQPTYYEWVVRSDLTSIQAKYDDANVSTKEEGYSLMTPFNFVGGIFSSVFAYLGTMVSSILGICRYGGEANADNATQTEQPKETKRA